MITMLKWLATLALLSESVAANASLISVDGGLGVYDTTNNVTWTSNATLMATQAAASGNSAAFVQTIINDSRGVIYDTPNTYDPSGAYTLSASDFNTSGGQMDWWGAQAWVHYLNVIDYGGSNQWALPTTVNNASSFGYPDGGTGPSHVSQSTSQIAELFYGGLGMVAGPGSLLSNNHNSNYSLFTDMQDWAYWSSTEYYADPSNGWIFSTDNGNQANSIKYLQYQALAVATGEINPVPLPASAWLMLSGVGGFAFLARKHRGILR